MKKEEENQKKRRSTFEQRITQNIPTVFLTKEELEAAIKARDEK